jgi:hypothetical protein
LTTTTCLVCAEEACVPLREVDGVGFVTCQNCGSVLAETSFIRAVEAGEVVNYQSPYWESEIRAAEERSHGSSLMRVAEIFRMCRIPVQRFIDIGSGTGSLLDAVDRLLPELTDRFYGIELFPPEPRHRSRHPNYRLGTLGDMTETFEAGMCIEVIEHMSPDMIRSLAADLAARSRPGSLFYFNSAQPGFVATHDPGYLDPLNRGHIASYSVAGAACLFGPAGFEVIALPGREWAFLVEFTGEPVPPYAEKPGADRMFDRLWHPNPENLAILAGTRFGPLMIGIGLESSRCYLEHATSNERTLWALSLHAELEADRAAAAAAAAAAAELTPPEAAPPH